MRSRACFCPAVSIRMEPKPRILPRMERRSVESVICSSGAASTVRVRIPDRRMIRRSVTAIYSARQRSTHQPGTSGQQFVAKTVARDRLTETGR